MVGIVTGGKDMKIIYPFELCIVEAGQFYKKKVPTDLTSAVVGFATKSPEDRLRTITNGVGLGQQGALAAPVSICFLIRFIIMLIIVVGS